jgi:hypothetical protein
MRQKTEHYSVPSVSGNEPVANFLVNVSTSILIASADSKHLANATESKARAYHVKQEHLILKRRVKLFL